MDELVLAIPTDKLWNILPYKKQGLLIDTSNNLDNIVKLGQFYIRKDIEEDHSFKQIIPYAILSHNESYFLLKRTTMQIEKRLHNKFSLGIGGHMSPGNKTVPNKQYVFEELKRELFEEVKLLSRCTIKDIKFIGFVNDDTIPVGKSHIGVIYDIRLSNKNLIVNETEKIKANWVNKPDLNNFYNGMETWSKIIFDSYIK